jgi:glycosyltransferase involved in cell wall biosynthesis
LRVLFTHVYSMSYARTLCERGEYPRQHLWGADRLEREGLDLEWGPFGGSEFLERATRATRLQLGHLEQEIAMARMADAGTVCYSGDQNLARGLAYLRRARLLRGRVAVVFHSLGPPSRGSGWVRGVDLAVCLSRRTRRELVERYGRDPARTPALRWGPDLSFAGYESRGAEFVVSAGKTDRDLPTLLEALRRTRLPARVYSLAPGPRADIPPGTDMVAPESGGPPLFEHTRVLTDLSRATVVAIPLADPSRLRGLSELNDAMALAKPVVMTRSPYFDFDIEEEGFGIWVDPGDVDGFARALDRLASDPEEAAAMGRNGRRFAEEHWNYELFCDELAAAFAELG